MTKEPNGLLPARRSRRLAESDSLPPIPDEIPPLALVRTPDRSVPSRSLDEQPARREAIVADEQSTNLFEAWDWDEADPLSVPPDTSAPFEPARRPVYDTPTQQRRPNLALAVAQRPEPVVVERAYPSPVPKPQPKRVADSSEGYRHVRALPTSPEPRPTASERGGHHPLNRRPRSLPPEEASDVFGTQIVLVPLAVRAHRSRAVVILMDTAAWLLGWASMFLVSLVSTASAGLVLFALTL